MSQYLEARANSAAIVDRLRKEWRRRERLWGLWVERESLNTLTAASLAA
jgi:hypothetical protein